MIIYHENFHVSRLGAHKTDFPRLLDNKLFKMRRKLLMRTEQNDIVTRSADADNTGFTVGGRTSKGTEGYTKCARRQN